MKGVKSVRKSNETYIKEVENVHGFKYDYSKTEYVNNKTKVCIICPEHGEFWQNAYSHLKGNGCKDCSIKYRTIRSKTSAMYKRDWNFEQPEDYKLIPLLNNKFTKVDNEDFDRLKNMCWYSHSSGYAFNKTCGLLHRYLINPSEDMTVDHINGDKLDNRRCNLRVATYSENRSNRSKKSGKNIYIGVKKVVFKNSIKYCVEITHEGIRYYLGHFENPTIGAQAYDLKCLELKREFATLNFPEKKEEYLKQINDEKKIHTREASRD